MRSKGFFRSLFLSLAAVIFVIRPDQVSAFINSANYRIQGESFTSGGNPLQESAGGYKLEGSVGETNHSKTDSTNFSQRGGSNYGILANGPGAPTVSNDTGSRYDRLHIVINPFDADGEVNGTRFAIQASTDGFASNIQYVKVGNTLGGTLVLADYQTYPAWNGSSGVTVTGLTASTTYSFRVRAYNGQATGTDWGPTASAATVAQILGVNINAGSCSSGGSAVGGSGISFGAISSGTQYTCGYTITTTTNAESGMQTNVRANQVTLTSGSDTISAFPGSWATPLAWFTPNGPANVLSGFLGYTTDDTSIQSAGGGNPFQTGTRYAAFETTNREIASATGPVAAPGQTNTFTTSLEIDSSQPNGHYSNMTMTLETTGNF